MKKLTTPISHNGKVETTVVYMPQTTADVLILELMDELRAAHQKIDHLQARIDHLSIMKHGTWLDDLEASLQRKKTNDDN